MYLGLFGVMIIGGATGWLSERLGLTRNGVPASVILGVGGAVMLYLASSMLGMWIGGRLLTGVGGAGIAVVVVPRLR